MRRTVQYVAFFATVLFSVGTALANCPTPASGPFFASYMTWYNYTPDPSCVVTSGNVTYASYACWPDPGYEFGGGWTNTASYTFTLGPNDPVLNSWSADAVVYFDDPNDSWYNQIQIKAIVTSNGNTTSTTLFSHDGTNGDLSCARPWGSFSATTGDTVTIEVRSTKWYSNTTIVSTFPNIFTTTP